MGMSVFSHTVVFHNVLFVLISFMLYCVELGQSVQGLGGSVSMPVCSANDKVEVESQPVVRIISPPVNPVESHNPELVPLPLHMPLVNGSRPTDSYTTETRLDYDTDIIGDDLDELLDRASPPESSLVSFKTTFLVTCPRV